MQTGEYRFYLFSLKRKKIIENAVISSGLGMAIKVFPLSDKIPNVTRCQRQTDFTCKQERRLLKAAGSEHIHCQYLYEIC